MTTTINNEDKMDILLEPKKGLRRKHLLYGGIGVGVFLLALWAGLGRSTHTLRVEAGQLTISPVTQGEFNDYIRLQGVVTPIQVVQISPEEGGIVKERVVEEGQPVRQGDVLVRLSNSGLDLQILNAEAELAEKQNLLRNTQITMQQDRLSNETESATLAMDVTRKQRNYLQNERLYREKLISREDYLQSKEDYELALKKKELITERLKQDDLYRKAQMEQMEENLKNMRRNVLLIRQRKEKLDIRATIDGELGLLDVALGQSVTAGEKIGQINDLSDFKVEAQVDEHYIDRVRTGLNAGFERDGKRYTLTLRKVFPEVREGKFRTHFVFTDKHPELIRPGQTYNLNLELGSPGQAILIPRGSFFQMTAGQWIFVVDANGRKAYRRAIRLGRQNPQYYEVEEGLQPGERVITSGYEAFKELYQSV